MSVRKKVRNGHVTWEVVVDRGPDPATGGRQQRTKSFKTQKEAKACDASWTADIAKGLSVDRSTQTVTEMLRSWLDAKRHDLKPTTLESYERTIEKEIIPAIGRTPVQKLTPAMLRDFYTRLRTAKKAKGVDGARCVQLCHMRLKQALDEAVNLGVVPRNVADPVKPPKVVSKEKQTWEPARMRRFLDMARGSGHGPLWAVIAATGLRRGEALGLRWGDLDEREGTLRVSQQVNVVGGAPYLQQRPKSDDSARVVPVDVPVIAALQRHKLAQHEQRLEADDWQDRDLIFCTRQGKPLNPNNVLRDYRALCKRAGLDSITIHGLRHSYATLAITSGADIKAVSQVIGHASTDITLRTYHHVGTTQHRDVASTIGAALFGEREDAV